jgi:hypothetical protein
MRPAAAARVLVVLLLATCGDPPAAGSPKEALAQIRAAIAAGDGGAYYDLLDAESAARSRAEVRERRALLERGDPAEEVLRGMPLTAEEMRKGEIADTVKLFFPRRSHFFRDAEWYAAATPAGEGVEGDVAWFDLAGAGGETRRLWFLLENGRWRFDQTRSLAEAPR